MTEEDSTLIELNVGGVYYKTTKKTLLQERDSYFNQIINNSSKSFTYENYNNKKHTIFKLFIDRNGDLFKYILDYLRNNKKLILPDNFKDFKRLQAEAKFYKLTDLEMILDEMIELNCSKTTGEK